MKNLVTLYIACFFATILIGCSSGFSGTNKHEERGSVVELVNKEEKGLIMENAQQVKQKGIFRILSKFLIVISIVIVNISFVLLFTKFFIWEDNLMHKYAKDKLEIELFSGCLGFIWPCALVLILTSSISRYNFFLFLKEKILRLIKILSK
jgi:hypothetical protein